MCPRPGQAAKENRGPLQDWLCQCGHSVAPAGTHKEPVGAMPRGGGQVMSETLGILVHGGDSCSREPRPSLFTANIFVLVAVCLLAQSLLLSFMSASDSSLLRTWEPKATQASVSRGQVERETYHQNECVVFKIYGVTPASGICAGLVVLRAERILRTVRTFAMCCLGSSLRRGVGVCTLMPPPATSPPGGAHLLVLVPALKSLSLQNCSRTISSLTSCRPVCAL